MPVADNTAPLPEAWVRGFDLAFRVSGFGFRISGVGYLDGKLACLWRATLLGPERPQNAPLSRCTCVSDFRFERRTMMKTLVFLFILILYMHIKKSTHIAFKQFKETSNIHTIQERNVSARIEKTPESP